MAAFGAVADDELLGGWEGGSEGDEGALAAAFHGSWDYQCEYRGCICLMEIVMETIT